MNLKEFLLNLGIATVTQAINAIIVTSGVGPNFKAACQNALLSLSALGVAAETPHE